ncbi:TIGR03086 family metal-binding protein [Actinokineospora enzanensis]|uniref:TIGR03086 family metal-binding protein n=1 Tax=Actinokineospora enzanensis TaxID=155975 RepID=UPI0003721F81|nr:TIGR03086 family metal-binding protein [Actinokineospora enzanensis]
MEKSQITRATERVAELARAVTRDQFDLPTPCPEWTVQKLANHLTLWSGIVAERTATRTPPPDDGTEDEANDHTTDWPTRFIDTATRAAQAWDAPGGLDGDTVMMGDPTPARNLHDMLLAELVLHGWDLAKATGHPFDIDPDIAETAHQGTLALADQAREYGYFGPEITIPDPASPLDHALATSGRDPSWRP